MAANKFLKDGSETVPETFGSLQQKVPYKGKSQQKENFPEVVMKMPKNDKVVAKVPNGEILTVLEVAGDGPDSHGRVIWKDAEGWVKMCNVIPAEPVDEAFPVAGTPNSDTKQLAELKEMTLEKYKQRALDFGCDEQAVEDVDKAEDPKQAVIDLVLLKMKADVTIPDAKNSNLRRQAFLAGALQQEVDDALDQPSMHRALLALILSKQVDFIDPVMFVDPVGFWEYRGDDQKYVPYSRDESLHMDIARSRIVGEMDMDVGHSKLPVTVDFEVDVEDGSIKGETQNSLTNRKICNIRREASARELVQKARSVMEDCMREQPDVRVPKYTKPESILEILRRETEPVKLLRGTWITKYTGNEGQTRGLPRRQDLEETVAAEAFFPSAQVKHDSCFNIFSISYCWRAWDHPDADGKQLRLIETELTGQMAKAYRGEVISADFGIFWDFCSLHQKDKKGRRTEKEEMQFAEALNCMDIWYMHAMIMTFIINGSLTRELGVDYEDRGWTHFERSCAELIKPAHAGGHLSQRPMIIELGGAGRKLPLSPELFAEKLAQRRFTSRGDKETVVDLYTRACMLAMRGTRLISLSGIKLRRDDGKQVSSVLSHCCSLKFLRLIDMDINDHECRTISAALPRMPELQELYLGRNNIGDAGVHAIAKLLPRMPKLEMLEMSKNMIGDAGAQEIAEVLPRISSLEMLEIENNNLTEAGKDALRQAWKNTGKQSCGLQV